MTPLATSSPPSINIDTLGLDEGAHLLVKRALARLPVGAELRVTGRSPNWQAHLEAWCRQHGHGVSFNRGDSAAVVAVVKRGPYQDGRWVGAVQTGEAGTASGAVVEAAPAAWGLAARGASVEAGSPAFDFRLARKPELWAETAGDLYRQALASQWDPATAIDWQAPVNTSEDIEDAVVQVMTYLIENENAALLVPARHLGQVHPHYREVAQLLAIQCADEARHVEVFTRRATLRRANPALSGAGGQASLKTLFDSHEFSLSALLLSVLGEGSFVNLLNFLHENAPDLLTRDIARLVARDEARHVAFGMAHLEYRLGVEPDYLSTLRAAVIGRHDALSTTAGLNEEVFDALVLLAAGALDHESIRSGFARVQALKRDMAAGRKARLTKLGFPAAEADSLSALHTRNFM
jgi:hypothetical protein